MNITNSFFNAEPIRAEPARCAIVYMIPSRGIFRPDYSFAEFEAARDAIERAFTQENWDGYGALPVGEEAKRNALGTLSQIEAVTHAPEITPNPNGTLSFGWETSRGFGQLEIGRTRYSFYVQPYEGRPLLDEGEVGSLNPTVGLLLEALLYPRPSRPVSVLGG